MVVVVRGYMPAGGRERVVLSEGRRRHASRDMNGTCTTHYDLTTILALRGVASVAALAGYIFFTVNVSTSMYVSTPVPGMMKETAVMFTVMLIIMMRLLLVLSVVLKVGPITLIEVPVGCLSGLLRAAVVTISARTPSRAFCFFRPIRRHVTIVIAAVRIMPVHSRVIGCRGRRIIVGRVRDGMRLITTIGVRVRLVR